MAKLKRDNQKYLANTFDALGHYRRIEIVRQLSQCMNNQAQFGHLCELSGLTPATLSFHLGKMQKGGLVTRKQVGNTSVVSLHLDRLQFAMDVITKF